MIYKDNFGNTAKIERVKLFAYCGATKKRKWFSFVDYSGL